MKLNRIRKDAQPFVYRQVAIRFIASKAGLGEFQGKVTVMPMKQGKFMPYNFAIGFTRPLQTFCLFVTN